MTPYEREQSRKLPASMFRCEGRDCSLKLSCERYRQRESNTDKNTKTHPNMNSREEPECFFQVKTI